MMERPQSTEIDLIKLLLDGIIFLKRKKWVILFFLLMGVLYSIYNFVAHPLRFKAYYKKDFVVESSVTTNEILSDMINNFPNVLNGLGKKDGVTNQQPLISPSTVKNFKGIDAKLSLVNNGQTSRLKITVEAYEKPFIDSIVGGVTAYFNSIDQFKSKFKLRLLHDQKLLEMINIQLAGFDSLKKSRKYSDENKSTAGLNENAEYKSYIELFEKKQGLERGIAYFKIIDFIEIDSPYLYVNNYVSSFLNIIGYSLLGGFTGILLAFVLEVLSKMKTSATGSGF
jgi:hypothetical protein